MKGRKEFAIGSLLL